MSKSLVQSIANAVKYVMLNKFISRISMLFAIFVWCLMLLISNISEKFLQHWITSIISFKVFLNANIFVLQNSFDLRIKIYIAISNVLEIYLDKCSIFASKTRIWV